MYHHDRRKNARGQAVVVLLAIVSFAFAGAGLGWWIGQYANRLPFADPPRSAPAFASALPPTNAAASSASRVHQTVDAIVSRLGDLQAELLRLNALGERLVGMSGLDPEEFDFANPPPQGGPELGPVRDYTIKEIASELSSVAGMIQDRQRKLDVLEDVLANKDLTARALPSSWPVRTGYVSSNFGFRIHPVKKVRLFHEGIDIACPRGTPILAVAEGVVAFSGRRNGYGRVVDIRHPDGLLTRYAHNTANLVKEGQRVRRGQTIASVGATGTATGPHVHFEVHKDGKVVNPMPYLNGRVTLGGAPARAADRSPG